MTITTTQATLSRQLDALAPATITYGGKTYRRSYVLSESDGLTLRQDYVARKARGAMIADKVSFRITYDVGSDTYDVSSIHFDGATFGITSLKDYSLVYADQLEMLGGLT